MRYAAPLAIALTLGLTSGCDATFVASFNADGLRVRVCKGDDEICENVLNPPKADAGTSRSVAGGTLVTLDGSASTDSDGHIAAFRWVQQDGPLVLLSDSSSATPSFDAPAVSLTTPLRFELTVTDDDDQSSSDDVEITVEPPAAMAASQGLAWLQAIVLPASGGLPRDSGRADTAGPVSIGLWLVATTTGRHLDRDPTHIETHLANLRGLITSLEQRRATEVTQTALGTTGISGSAPHEMRTEISARAVLSAGLAQTGALLESRDPSLAERFHALSGTIGVAPAWESLDRLFQGGATLERSGGSVTVSAVTGIGADEALRQATTLLSELKAENDSDPLAVAAATLIVLGALNRDSAQRPSSPTSTQIPLSQRSTASPLLTNAPSPYASPLK